uniref:Uncharacterized protein n=1 Tax=Aegilops tauschii subsp. strangulata TaxID=200361 RepID=A0A453F5V6_AEGTS
MLVIDLSPCHYCAVYAAMEVLCWLLGMERLCLRIQLMQGLKLFSARNCQRSGSFLLRHNANLYCDGTAVSKMAAGLTPSRCKELRPVLRTLIV